MPRARLGSNFTLLFEPVVMILAREMLVATIASCVGTTDKRLWRVINSYVAVAMKRVDLSRLKACGLDETACKRGHRYVTGFIDLDRDDRPVVFATEGKGKQAIE